VPGADRMPRIEMYFRCVKDAQKCYVFNLRTVYPELKRICAAYWASRNEMYFISAAQRAQGDKLFLRCLLGGQKNSVFPLLTGCPEMNFISAARRCPEMKCISATWRVTRNVFSLPGG
jgi:hypothetical protein